MRIVNSIFDLTEILTKHNESAYDTVIHAIILHTTKGFKPEYQDFESRAYYITNQNNLFVAGKISTSYVGDSLDGKDAYLRLDAMGWDIEKIYILNDDDLEC